MNPWEDESKADAVARQERDNPTCDTCCLPIGISGGCDGHEDEASS